MLMRIVTHTEREQSSRYEYAHEAQAAAPTYERHPPTHNLQDVAIQHFPPLFPEGYPSSTTSYRPEHLHPAIPQVTGYQPDRGGPGTRLQVFFQSTHDFNLLPMWQFTITLHSYRCFTSQAYSGDFHDGYMVYWVECQIPMLEVLSWTTYVHLQLDVEDSSGHRVASIPVGHFIFDVPQPALIQPGRQESPRKRKSPSDRLIAPKQPTKRASTQSLASNPRSVHSSNSPLSQSHSSPRMTFEPSNTSAPRLSKSQSKLTRSRTPDSRIPRQSREARMTDSRRNAPRKNQDTSSRVLPRLEISLTAASSSPGTSSAATPSRSISLSPTNQHPRLVRTSTLMSDSTAQSGSFTASHLPINQPDLANLELEGDLDAMADDWTDEEKSTKRRIIRFTRSQDGSTINVSFEPVTLDDIDGDGLYVSCIWWNGKQNAFVTSVDTLNLLEYLVNVRFTTKEKNRVRRNLEGLRPLTVSKSTFENRSNEDNFFRLVMGFPKPRPRNIEKDVKVFPWKDLSIALKKIIGKYVSFFFRVSNDYLLIRRSPRLIRLPIEPSMRKRIA